MGFLKAGKLLTADILNDLLGETVSADSSASATTTSTSYVESWTGGTPAGIAFVAPTSGKVIIHNSARVFNNGANRTYFSWVLRNGAVVGSGTTVFAANDTWAVQSSATPKEGAFGRALLVTGLTPGNSYNVRQAMKVDAASTATSQFRQIVVKPVV